MSKNHIHPNCPNCDSQQNDDNGVSLTELMVGQKGKFVWICMQCWTKHVGVFSTEDSSVKWRESESVGLLQRLIIRVIYA